MQDALTVGNGVTLNNAGTFTSATGGVTVLAGGTIINTGTFTSQNSSMSVRGRLTGTGTLGVPTTVQLGGRLAPGNGIGTLTVTAPVTVTGGTGTTWEVAFAGVAPNTPATASTQAGRLALTGSATLNLSATSTNKITLHLTQVGGSLTHEQPVSYVIATAPAGSAFLTDGGAFAFDPNRFAVTASFGSVTSFELLVVNNNLVFQFVPVPEPVTGLGVAVFGLAARIGVRRLRRDTPVAV